MRKLFSIFLFGHLMFGAFCVAHALPSGYTELEYIESNGSQYINTGISSTGVGITVETKVMWTSFTSGDGAIFGRDYNSGFELYADSSEIALYNSDNLWVRGPSSSTNTVYIISASVTNSGATFTVNGTTYNSSVAPANPREASLVLFRHNNKYYARARMYYLKLYKNGTLVRDFVPALRNSDSAVGMYDAVSGDFFTNSGSGSFTAGYFGMNYNVTYSCGTGGGNPPSSTTAISNVSFTPATNTCTVENGYGFSGWLVSGTNDVKPAGTAFTWTYTTDKTLTAQYTGNTININWWDGNTQLSVQSAAQSCTYGGLITLPPTPADRTGYVFNGWKIKSVVPSGYTELEYIESNGSQYIYTGVYSDGVGLTVETKVMWTSLSSRDGAIFGRHNASGFELYADSSNVSLYNSPGLWILGPASQTNTIYTISASVTDSGGTLVVNGQTYSSAATPYYPGSDALVLFRHAQTYEPYARMYYLKLYKDGTLVRDFIPVRRDSDSAVGLYDKVSKNFFTNSGSGTFTAGPNVH